MTWDAVAPFFRHALQFASGLLVARGVLDAAHAEILAGGLLSIGSVAWWYLTRARTMQ